MMLNASIGSVQTKGIQPLISFVAEAEGLGRFMSSPTITEVPLRTGSVLQADDDGRLEKTPEATAVEHVELAGGDSLSSGSRQSRSVPSAPRSEMEAGDEPAATEPPNLEDTTRIPSGHEVPELPVVVDASSAASVGEATPMWLQCWKYLEISGSLTCPKYSPR
eukprot:s2178_g2.t1